VEAACCEGATAAWSRLAQPDNVLVGIFRQQRIRGDRRVIPAGEDEQRDDGDVDDRRGDKRQAEPLGLAVEGKLDLGRMRALYVQRQVSRGRVQGRIASLDHFGCLAHTYRIYVA